MVIMQTNGVSFSLVAGACCIVNFSYPCATDNVGYIGKWSLNINSTGAKNVVYYFVQASTNSTHHKILSYSSASAYIGFNAGCDLLIYNGSTYVSTGELDRFYSDYGD